MKRSFKVNFREDHIHVEIARDFKVEPENLDEFWGVIKELCEEHGSRRVLIEGFVPEGERDAPVIVDAGLRAAVLPNVWLAICLEGEEPEERRELFVVIAARQGVRAKFFNNSKKALKWLRVNAPA